MEKEPSSLNAITALTRAAFYLLLFTGTAFVCYEMLIGNDREQRVIKRHERTINALKTEVRQLKYQIKKLDDPTTRHAR